MDGAPIFLAGLSESKRRVKGRAGLGWSDANSVREVHGSFGGCLWYFDGEFRGFRCKFAGADAGGD
jgi:hypothetical protein